MATYRDKRDGRWRYRKVVRLPDGSKIRISGMSTDNTKVAAHDAEREHVRRAQNPEKEKVPTFEEWFNGRFWDEWVVGRKNKPSEVEAKRCIYRVHLKKRFGSMPIDRIGVGQIAQFRAALVKLGRTEKRINNVLTVLSKALRYAADVELIDRAPRVGIFKTERPEIVCWEIDEYARLLAAAKLKGPEWYAATCLAGEAGLRIGEVKALRWKEDVDLAAGTVTINQQTRKGETGTPKGRTRRTLPMTPTLLGALRQLEEIRVGFVLRNLDGTQKTDRQADFKMEQICLLAGLPVRKWHALRHSFGTHAAMFGVNPWRLMKWMGHKRIDVTMGYVNMAEDHARTLPDAVVAAGQGESDPDRRVIKMLSARANSVPTTRTVEAPIASISDR